MSSPDLHSVLRALVAPLTVGDVVAEGYALAAVSIELGPRLKLQRDGHEIVVEVSPLAAGLRSAVQTNRLGLSYRSGATEDPVEPSLGLSLCRALARLVERNEARVLTPPDTETAAARVREVRVRNLLEPMGPPGERFFALSPYVGCLIGCRYCYAQSRLAGARRLMALPTVPWGSWVDVRINAPEVLRDELAAGVHAPIKFCPVVSDPYQAVESRFGLTGACLQALADCATSPPTMLLTRSASVVGDLPRLAALRRAAVGVSLPTVDDAVRQHFEPRAASVTERLEILRAARAAGLRTFAVVQPILPGPLAVLAERLAEHADSVRIDVLRGEEGATADFDDPRHAPARHDAWQADAADELRADLQRRGIALWTGELPPELMP